MKTMFFLTGAEGGLSSRRGLLRAFTQGAGRRRIGLAAALARRFVLRANRPPDDSQLSPESPRILCRMDADINHTPVRARLWRAGIVFPAAAMVLAGMAGQALALDQKAVIGKDQSPWAVFRFGFSAYKNGNKDKAVEAYRYAAEKGQVGASWKLAHMYAEGDGVARNDYEAFKFFSAIVQQDVRPGSPDDSYVSDALVAIGNYLRSGIPGTPVKADPVAAQEYFMRAAATYRNPDAQYQVGKMYLSGEGVEKNLRQAGRWLQLAAEKGHCGAEATLGNLLFQSGRVVRGLAMMTAALDHAGPEDMLWIRSMQEEAFALAGESDRRTAIALADDIIRNGLK